MRFVASLFLVAVLLTASLFRPDLACALIGLKEGDAPKKVVLDDLSGVTVDVSRHFGKNPVILVFWELTTDSSFLNYSLEELLFLNTFYQEHAKDGLQVFAIYTPHEEKDIPDQEVGAVRDLVTTNQVGFPVLIDRGFRSFREYGVIALPSTIMINRSGIIEFIYPSFPLASRPLFSERIKELMGVSVARKEEGVKVEDLGSHAHRLYRYALEMFKRGLLEQSLSPLKKSLEFDADYAWSHNLLGVILWKKGDSDGSIAAFQKALKLEPDNAQAHFNYGLSLFALERYEDAEGQFRKVTEIDSSLAEAHFFLGLTYRKTDREQESMVELRKAHELFVGRDLPPEPRAHNVTTFQRISTLSALADLYLRLGDHDNALNYLQQAIQIALGLEKPSPEGEVRRTRDMMLYE